MKQNMIRTYCLLIALCAATMAQAQTQELIQLGLNIEKLNQLRSILNNMYSGYKIITKGYNTVKDLTEGNFSLHKVFLDNLWQVNPVVKKYKRVADIIDGQRRLVSEYKEMLNVFREIKVFDEGHVQYIESVYNNLFKRSLQDIDELLLVITANQLRMNDAERLTAIDRIHASVQDKLAFLRAFNDETGLLAEQRQRERLENASLKRLYGIE